jgi:hypothetical protein
MSTKQPHIMKQKGLKLHDADYVVIRKVAFDRGIKMIDLLHLMVQDLPEVKKGGS